MPNNFIKLEGYYWGLWGRKYLHYLQNVSDGTVERIVLHKDVHILIRETWEHVAYVEKRLCQYDKIKNLKVKRLYWIIWVGPI